MSSLVCLSAAAGRRVDLRDILQLCLEFKHREAFQVCLAVNSPEGMALGLKPPSLRKCGSGQCAFGFWLHVQTGSRLPWAIHSSFPGEQPYVLCLVFGGLFSQVDSEDAGFAQGLWGLGSLGFIQVDTPVLAAASIGMGCGHSLPMGLFAWRDQ